MQKKPNELNIKGDHGRLEEDGVFGPETLSAWTKFLNTLEHGTVPTLTWIDPLTGHDIKFKITNGDYGIGNVIANSETNHQYYRIDPPHYYDDGRYKKVKIKGKWVDADFNHINIQFRKPRTKIQRFVEGFDHLHINIMYINHFIIWKSLGEKFVLKDDCCVLPARYWMLWN